MQSNVDCSAPVVYPFIIIRYVMFFASQELYKFSAYIVRKFTEEAQRNPVLYAEALFWKDGAACFELQNGYGTAQTSK